MNAVRNIIYYYKFKHANIIVYLALSVFTVYPVYLPMLTVCEFIYYLFIYLYIFMYTEINPSLKI